MRCGYNREDDAERLTPHRRQGAVQGICTEGTRASSDAGMDFVHFPVGEPNAGAVQRAAMAVTAFGPGGDAPDDEDDGVTLTLLF